MRRTVGKKILTVIFIPFLVIFGVLSAFIAYSVTQFVTNWTQLELKGIAEINAADLAGRMYSVRISVLTAADAIDILEGENNREQAENIIMSMFENMHIYNAWIAAEPDMFGGSDKGHENEYPGAPSGRFVRSYVIEDGKIVTAPDMDETTLDDPELSPWYVTPRDTDALYIDVDNDIPNLYDYGLGQEPVYTLSIASPIHRDGKVIGCVGADVMFDVATFGIGNEKQAAVAVFYPNGRIFYSQNMELAEESVFTLGFNAPERIMEAISANKSLFLSDEYSVFLGQHAYTYIQPVNVGHDDNSTLYLYVAAPKDVIFGAFQTAILLAVLAGVVVLSLIIAMYVYLMRRISKPIRALTLAADAISQGDLEAEISSFTGARDEIGVLARSLHKMVEQFRVYIVSLKQSQEEMSVYRELHEFLKTGDIEESCGKILAMLCQRFGFTNATVAEAPALGTFVMQYNAHDGSTKINDDFSYHIKAESISAGKKLVFLNSHAVKLSDAPFFDGTTKSACILPLRTEYEQIGWIILQSDRAHNPFDAGAESIIVYIAVTFAEWLSKNHIKVSSRQPLPESPQTLEKTAAEFLPGEKHGSAQSGQSSLDALRTVSGIEADAAIDAMGGLYDVFEGSVKLLARLLPETIAKLEQTVMIDINDFAIEIHGLKGSLNNIGAYELGRAAYKLEQLSKDGDISECQERLPEFLERIRALNSQLNIALDLDAPEKPQGDLSDLKDAILRACDAADAFDSLEALDIMRPLDGFMYEGQVGELIGKALQDLEVFDCISAKQSLEKLKDMI